MTTDFSLYGDIKIYGNVITISATNFSGQSFSIGYNDAVKNIYGEGGYKLTETSGVWSIWKQLTQKTVSLPSTSDIFSLAEDNAIFPFGVTAFVVSEIKGGASNFPFNNFGYYVGEVTKVSGSSSIKISMTDQTGTLFTNFRNSSGIWNEWKGSSSYKWLAGATIPTAGTSVIISSTARACPVEYSGRVDFVFTDGTIVSLSPKIGASKVYGVQHTATASQKRTFSVNSGGWEIGQAVAIHGNTFVSNLKEVRVIFD
jgi:hypothetical protein